METKINLGDSVQMQVFELVLTELEYGYSNSEGLMENLRASGSKGLLLKKIDRLIEWVQEPIHKSPINSEKLQKMKQLREQLAAIPE